MRSSIGIDEFNISQGDVGGNSNKRRITSRVVGSMQDSSGATNDQILTIGKRITNRVRLVYEQSLGQADSLLRLFTRMKYGVMFIVGTGSDTTLDFFYRYVRGLPPRDKDDKTTSPPPWFSLFNLIFHGKHNVFFEKNIMLTVDFYLKKRFFN